MSRVIKAFCCLTSLLAVMAGSFVTAMAMSDGAYVAGRSTSYVNPETGETYDGGTNIALGDSMCASIVDDQVLIEQVNGKIYVTVGFGLMSNISDIRIAVQSSSGGSYSNVSITQTGTITKNGDNCNQYRFEVPSLNVLIRPTFYVGPMGRDVTFYISINSGSLTAGTGNFTSEFFGSAGSSVDSGAGEASGSTAGSATGSQSSAASNQAGSSSSAQSSSDASTSSDTAGVDNTEDASATESTQDSDQVSESDQNSNDGETATESEAQRLAEAASSGDVSALFADVKGLTVYRVKGVNTAQTDATAAADTGISSGTVAGIVAVGIAILAAIIGGVVFYLRRKNRKEAFR